MDRLELIETLKHFPNTYASLVDGLSETALRYKPADNEWSIKEATGHVVFMDHVWYRRLYMVWAQNDPLLPVFDSEGEQAAVASARDASDLRPLLAELRQSRGQIVDVLAHAIDWTRIGTWRGVGRRSLRQLAEALLAHDEDHLQQVRNLLAAQAAAARA
jgi:hypothetical protein